MGDVWERRGRTLRDVAKAAVDHGGRLGAEHDVGIADGWGGSYGKSGLCTQIGSGGEHLCPGKRAGRWTIAVKDTATGECGVWDFRKLRGEMEREATGLEVQGSLL